MRNRRRRLPFKLLLVILWSAVRRWRRGEDPRYPKMDPRVPTVLSSQEGDRLLMNMLIEGADDPHTQSLSVLYLDLDKFGVMNTELGHSTVDELLVLIGARLCTGIRASDMLSLCRKGEDLGDLSRRGTAADEFVLIGFTSRETMEKIGERLLEMVTATPFVARTQTISVSFTYGVESYEFVSGASLDELQALEVGDRLLEKAEREMMANKARKGTVHEMPVRV